MTKKQSNDTVLIKQLRLEYLSGASTAAEIATQLHAAGITPALLSEQEALDYIGITELRRTLAYSPKEVDAMWRRNESFSGKRADFAKLRLYQEIKGDLIAFMQECNEVKRMEEVKPNPYEKNALICLDMEPIAIFNKEKTTKLAVIMGKVDRVIMSAGNAGLRLSFCVENIWTD